MDFNASERRKYKRMGREYSRAMQLGNGQVITTIPRELTRMYKIGKGSLFKWSDGGQSRVIIEVISEPKDSKSL